MAATNHIRNPAEWAVDQVKLAGTGIEWAIESIIGTDTAVPAEVEDRSARVPVPVSQVGPNDQAGHAGFLGIRTAWFVIYCLFLGQLFGLLESQQTRPTIRFHESVCG